MGGDLQTSDSTEPHAGVASGARAVPEKSGPLHAVGLKLRAFPVFDLRKGVASTFFCVPARISSGGNKFGHWLLSEVGDVSRAAVDTELLSAAITYAARYDDAKVLAAIGVSVSFSTLVQADTRNAYLSAFARARDLKTPLVVKIELVPQGTLAGRFAELVAYLRPFVRRVFVSVPDLRHRMWETGQLGAAGIGTLVAPEDGYDAITAKSQVLNRLCATQGAVAFMDGLVLPEAAEAAVAAGIRFGTGPALSLTLFPLDGGLPKVPFAARS